MKNGQIIGYATEVNVLPTEKTCCIVAYCCGRIAGLG